MAAQSATVPVMSKPTQLALPHEVLSAKLDYPACAPRLGPGKGVSAEPVQPWETW